MASNYAGNPTTAAETVELMTGGDRPTAQLFRVPLERTFDNDALQRLKRLERDVLCMRSVWRSGLSITDTAESLGAAHAVNPLVTTPSTHLVIVKTAQAFAVGDEDLLTEQGAPSSITSLVTDCANGNASHQRILAIGTGGNRNSFSDDNGVTWTAGGNIGATPKRVIFNESFFICTQGASSVSRSSNGVTWTANASAGVVPASGLAAFSDGNVVAMGSLTGTVRWSSDNGANFSSAANIPNAGSLDGNGSVAGNCGTACYHAGAIGSGAEIQVSGTSDSAGTGWGVIANIAAPAGDTFGAEPRLMMCRTTGVLVIVAPLAGGRSARYASLDGVHWTSPRFTPSDPGVDAYALAGGKLCMTVGDQIFVSSGVGGVA